MTNRASKNQRRVDFILTQIPSVLEQFQFTLEQLEADYGTNMYQAAASTDFNERNRVAAVERLFEELVNWMDELAERMLAEARRRNLVGKQPGPTYAQLVEQRVITSDLASLLEAAKDLRDLLQHGYPLSDEKSTHVTISTFPKNLGGFLRGFERWRDELGL